MVHHRLRVQKNISTGSAVVRHKVRQSYISRIVWPRITQFYTDIYTDRIWRHHLHPVRRYRRTVCRRITKFYVLIGDNWPCKPAGYDVTSCFQSVAKFSKYCTKLRKTGPGRHRDWYDVIVYIRSAYINSCKCRRPPIALGQILGCGDLPATPVGGLLPVLLLQKSLAETSGKNMVLQPVFCRRTIR